MSPTVVDSVREKASADYRKKLTEQKEIDDKLKPCKLLLLLNRTSKKIIVVLFHLLFLYNTGSFRFVRTLSLKVV